jgi:pilus assembly protein CpaB
MKNRAIIPLVIGLAVGLVAVKLSVDVVQRARAAGGSEDMLSIVVAQQTIPMGIEIKPTMLSITKTSKSLAPQGLYSDPKKLAGRVARSAVPKGMPVIEEMLAAPGTPAGMASLVPAGYRAVAVKVDEETSVAGFLKPGCHVDVAAVMSVRGASGGATETISKILLQDVIIAAVGQSLTGDTESSATLSRSVILLVKPEELALLHLAASQGKLRLAMRHYDDMGDKTAVVAHESDLDPNAPKPQDNKQQGAGFLTGLGKLFQREQPATGEAPKPAWTGQFEKKDEPTQFVVNLMHGNTVETLAFENSSSMQRVSGGRAPNTLAAADATPPKGTGPGKTTVAAAEPAGNDVPAAPVERGE